MTSPCKVEYEDKVAQIELANQSQCMQFIKDVVIPSLFNDSGNLLNEVSYRKVTKNDNIQQTIEKLEKASSQLLCIYSYGTHIQKMLSILEIFKKVMKKDPNGTDELHQWNKLTSFVCTREGRNELLERRTRVPILITLVRLSTLSPAFVLKLEQAGFTVQL